MTDFNLDPKLKQDCILLGESKTSILLLMNNSIVPWFILVPKVDETEFYQLEQGIQKDLVGEINAVSEFVTNAFQPDKLNVAAIGNVVKQLHVHVIGRFETDACWPGVVWGADERTPYANTEISDIRASVSIHLDKRFRLLG